MGRSVDARSNQQASTNRQARARFLAAQRLLQRPLTGMTKAPAVDAGLSPEEDAQARRQAILEVRQKTPQTEDPDLAKAQRMLDWTDYDGTDELAQRSAADVIGLYLGKRRQPKGPGEEARVVTGTLERVP